MFDVLEGEKPLSATFSLAKLTIAGVFLNGIILHIYFLYFYCLLKSNFSLCSALV